MLYCLMSSGAPLTNAMRNHLFRVAREMVKHGSRKRSFKTDDFEGQVIGRGERASMGSLSGPHFTAVIESERMSTKVSFIVDDGDLRDIDQLEWETLSRRDTPGPSLN